MRLDCVRSLDSRTSVEALSVGEYRTPFGPFLPVLSDIQHSFRKWNFYAGLGALKDGLFGDLVPDPTSFSGLHDPHAQFQVDLRFLVPANDDNGCRVQLHSPHPLGGLDEKQLGTLNAFLGASKRYPESYIATGHRVIDDVPLHDFVVGHHDDQVVGILDLRSPQADIDHVSPRSGLPWRAPQFDPVPDFKRAVDDKENAGDQVRERILCGKRQCQPDYAGSRKQGSDLESELG